MTKEQAENLIIGTRLEGENADLVRAQVEEGDLDVFCILNTNDRPQFVIAKNARYAKLLSRQSGHIHHLSNGRAYFAEKVPRLASRAFLSSARRAAADRTPGIVEQRGNHAVMGDRVYSPLVGL